MKKMLLFICLVFSLHLFGQTNGHVTLPLSNSRVSFTKHLNHLNYKSSGDTIIITSLLTGQYMVTKDKDAKRVDYDKETVLGLGTYYFNSNLELQTYDFKFVNYKNYKNMDIGQMNDERPSRFVSVRNGKDIVSLKEAGFENAKLTKVDKYLDNAVNVFSGAAFTKGRLTEAELPVYPQKLYASQANAGMIANNFKGFTSINATLKNNTERLKAINGLLYDNNISKQYVLEKKNLDMAYFHADEKYKKAKLGSYTTDELSGNIVTSLGYIGKKGMQRFGFIGFDKDGKVLNEHFEEFSYNKDFPATWVYEREKPVLKNRPSKIGYFFFSQDVERNNFNLVLVDSVGKLIKSRSYKTSIYQDDVIASTYGDDGSIFLSTWFPGSTKMNVRNMIISPNDSIQVDVINLNQIAGNEKNFYNNKFFKSFSRYYYDDQIKTRCVLLNQLYYINPENVETKKTFYDGFCLTTHDEKGLVVDYYHLGMIQNDKPTFKQSPFDIDCYHSSSGNEIYVVYRMAAKDPKSTSDVYEYQFALFEVDASGKILNKPEGNNINEFVGDTPIKSMHDQNGFFSHIMDDGKTIIFFAENNK